MWGKHFFISLKSSGRKKAFPLAPSFSHLPMHGKDIEKRSICTYAHIITTRGALSREKLLVHHILYIVEKNKWCRAVVKWSPPFWAIYYGPLCHPGYPVYTSAMLHWSPFTFLYKNWRREKKIWTYALSGVKRPIIGTRLSKHGRKEKGKYLLLFSLLISCVLGKAKWRE